MASKAQVVVLGGGFGGLEAAFYLRHKGGDAMDLTLVSDQAYFLFKPNTIYIPFGQDPETLKIDLAKPTQRKNIRFVQGLVRRIDPDAKTVELETGKIRYDYLIIATGAGMRPEEIPGLKDHALTVWTPQEMLRLRDGLAHLVSLAKAGTRQDLLFLIPPNNRCAGPLYELVLMTETWFNRQKVRDHVGIHWATFEDGYIQAFGPRLNTVVTTEFRERGIEGHKVAVATSVEPGLVKSSSTSSPRAGGSWDTPKSSPSATRRISRSSRRSWRCSKRMPRRITSPPRSWAKSQRSILSPSACV